MANRGRDPQGAWSARSRWGVLAVLGLAGASMGGLAKLADTSTLAGAADLGTYFGVWILIATLIAAWSPRRTWAALRVGAFMSAMVAAYYLVSWWILGFFPLLYFMAWAAAAVVVAPLFAVVVWPARRQGWWSAAAAALPVGLLLAEAFSFRWVLPRYLVQFIFDIGSALVLLVVLPRRGAQRLRVLALTPPLWLAAVGLQRSLPWILGALRHCFLP